MAEIIGQFDVVLPGPIVVSFDVWKNVLEPCQFQVGDSGDSMVSILPVKFKKPAADDKGDQLEESELIEVRVWVRRLAATRLDGQDHQKLANGEDKKFESILVQAIEQFVTAIKQRTKQSNLDTTYPVRAYDYKYFQADSSVETDSPLEMGQKQVPRALTEHILRSISVDISPGLTKDIWKQVVEDLKSP